MLVQKEDSYSNFVNSINSEQTRQIYEFSLSKFLKYYQMDLDSFLRLPQQEISNLIINYLVDEKKKISRQYKVIIFSAIKHACEMNDVVLNWKKQEIKFILNGDPPKKVRERYEQKGITDINLMKYHSPSKRSRIEAVRKIVGGLCCKCGNFNSHLHKQKISGAVIVTRYCSEHVPLESY